MTTLSDSKIHSGSSLLVPLLTTLVFQCMKVVGGDLLDHFSLMTNFLRKSCQEKPTTQRLSRYLKVVTGSSLGSSSVERLS